MDFLFHSEGVRKGGPSFDDSSSAEGCAFQSLVVRPRGRINLVRKLVPINLLEKLRSIIRMVNNPGWILTGFISGLLRNVSDYRSVIATTVNRVDERSAHMSENVEVLNERGNMRINPVNSRG